MNTFFYELGKWLGDRRGYPRVGLINTEKRLINDIKNFLKRFNKPITCREVSKKECRTMYCETAYEVFIVDSKLHKEFEKESMNFLNLNKSNNDKDLSFLGGFIDAEGSIDLKNHQIVLSVGHKNSIIEEGVINLIRRLKLPLRVWNCQKEWKLSIKSSESIINLLKRYVKHPKKRLLLNNEMPVSDEKYLDFIKLRSSTTSNELARKFNIHIDSARRVLRYFNNIGLIKRIRTSTNPYQYILK